MTDPTPEAELYTRAVEALKRKVSGYTLEESKKTYVWEQGRKRVKDETTVRKDVAPDLAAIRFVLTQLNPALWGLKPGERGAADEEGSGMPDLSRLSQAALEELDRLCEA